MPAGDRVAGLGEGAGRIGGGDPEHDLVAALLGAGGGGGDLGGDQRRDVIDVSGTDRNDDLDPVHDGPYHAMTDAHRARISPTSSAKRQRVGAGVTRRFISRRRRLRASRVLRFFLTLGFS